LQLFLLFAQAIFALGDVLVFLCQLLFKLLAGGGNQRGGERFS